MTCGVVVAKNPRSFDEVTRQRGRLLVPAASELPPKVQADKENRQRRSIDHRSCPSMRTVVVDPQNPIVGAYTGLAARE